MVERADVPVGRHDVFGHTFDSPSASAFSTLRRGSTALCSMPMRFGSRKIEGLIPTAIPELGVPNRITSGESREVIGFSRVYFAFADQLVQLVQDVPATVLELRHDGGERALGVYGTVKSVNRPNRKPAVPNQQRYAAPWGARAARRRPCSWWRRSRLTSLRERIILPHDGGRARTRARTPTSSRRRWGLTIEATVTAGCTAEPERARP
jgi:hypothetical protein